MRAHRTKLTALSTAVALILGLVVGVGPARADNDNDAMCYTTRSTRTPFYAGASASRVYDWNNTGSQTDRRFRNSGIPIPAGLLDNHYVPQGLTVWHNWQGNGSTEDIFLITAYHDPDHDGKSDTGYSNGEGPSAIFGVVANGTRRGRGLGRMLIERGHVGGIAVYGGRIYVGSERRIRWYTPAQVRDGLMGANTNHIYGYGSRYRNTSYDVGFMGTGGGFLWAGRFEEFDSGDPHLNKYVHENGQLVYKTQYDAPRKTQGVAVTSDRVIFSTSYRRDWRSNVWVTGRHPGTIADNNSYCFRAPTMSEGVTVYGGELYVLYESAAKTYSGSTNPIYNLHVASVADVVRPFNSCAACD